MLLSAFGCSRRLRVLGYNELLKGREGGRERWSFGSSPFFFSTVIIVIITLSGMSLSDNDFSALHSTCWAIMLKGKTKSTCRQTREHSASVSSPCWSYSGRSSLSADTDGLSREVILFWQYLINILSQTSSETLSTRTLELKTSVVYRLRERT